MRVAALYDIHGNLPALEAVLDELQGIDVDQVVVGGDVLPGPMPGECLAPRNDTECFTRETADDRLAPILAPTGAALVVCGHTHMAFDRAVGEVRVVNAGSVGMPFGEPGAYWLLLDGGVELRRTSYDLVSAAGRVRATSYPQAETFAATSVLQPMSEDDALAMFRKVELG